MVLISEIPEAYSRNEEHHEIGNLEEYHRDMANVMVMGGVDDDAHGLDESVSEFRKHHADVAEKLLNISGVGTLSGQPVKLTEPRPPYKPQEFPFALYKPGEDEPRIVNSAEERRQALQEGWRIEPVVKPQVAVLDPATEKRMLLDANKQQQAQITVQSEMIEKQTKLMQELQNRLEQLETAGRRKSA